MTVVNRRTEAWWWMRWLMLYAPGQMWHRLTTCRTKHRGPMYDGAVCLTCGKDTAR